MSNEKETKRCRHCQTEIPKGAKVCPNCRKKQGGKWKWVILAVVVVGIAGAAGSSGDSEKEDQVQKVANVSNPEGNQDMQADSGKAENQDAQADSNETGNNEKESEPGKKQDDEENGENKAGTNEGNKNASDQGADNTTADKDGTEDIFVPGDVIETSVFQISYLSAEEYHSDNEFIQPDDGNMFYKMEFEFENISSSDKYISSSEFDCYADSYNMDRVWVDAFDLDATISPGRKTKGAVIFEVPSDSKEVLLEYETSFWTQNKIIFRVK